MLAGGAGAKSDAHSLNAQLADLNALSAADEDASGPDSTRSTGSGQRLQGAGFGQQIALLTPIATGQAEDQMTCSGGDVGGHSLGDGTQLPGNRNLCGSFAWDTVGPAQLSGDLFASRDVGTGAEGPGGADRDRRGRSSMGSGEFGESGGALGDVRSCLNEFAITSQPS